MKKIILSAAFLALGTFAMAQQNTSKMQQKDPAQMEQKRQDKMKMMQSELNLSDAQMTKIQALQEKKMAEKRAMAPQVQAERKSKMEAMKANHDQWNNEMKQILTPEQYQKWETSKKDKMQNKRKNMQHHQMMKMPAKN
ncbi:hypothetical protein L0B70_07415 [Kaistella sp. 97-N-M2]|uniref:hypothetical protein n=1 Tax=Kaistella sp. 97-N-M2 TaxID=2908645 RepID=UPI001F230FBF|nr:hypothetical protein [Kaistella sp. 97-N-M2]UJF28702.1 hypothetical protein L0B70_07415 [Kaistella sp. 97-N-M2]